MLKSLSRLTLTADGQYATSAELTFLHQYLESVKIRISAYEKIRNNEADIIAEIEARKEKAGPNLFQMGNHDVREICRRDMTDIIRCTVAAMLFDELEQLQNRVLLWYRTIVKAFNYERNADITYDIIQSVINSHLAEAEVAAVKPFFELDHLVLSS